MGILSGRYRIDGFDLYDTYGFHVSTGRDPFFQYPKLKEPPSHDWKDENGVQYDLSNPTYETKYVTLKGIFYATSDTDFKAKHKALFSLLSTAGTRKLEVVDMGVSAQVFYRENPVAEAKTTAFKRGGMINVYMELKFEVVNGGFFDSTIGQIYTGPVAAFPTTWNEVTALSSQSEADGKVINMNTGTIYNKFTFVARTSKSILKVLDLSASNSVLTSAYTVRTASITNPATGEIYKVWGLSQAVKYNINHIHQFTTA